MNSITIELTTEQIDEIVTTDKEQAACTHYTTATHADRKQNTDYWHDRPGTLSRQAARYSSAQH